MMTNNPEWQDEPTEEEMKLINQMRTYADMLILRSVKAMRRSKERKINEISWKEVGPDEDGFNGILTVGFTDDSYIKITVVSNLVKHDDAPV